MTTHGMCFITVCLSSEDKVLYPGSFSPDSNQPSSERNCAKHSTWCQIAWPPNFFPTSESCDTFLILTSSFVIFKWQPAHVARPDLAYSMPKSLISLASSPDISVSAERFLPFPFFGCGTTAVSPIPLI